MPAWGQSRRRRIAIVIVCLAVLIGWAVAGGFRRERTIAGVPFEKALVLGERMYRMGTLPSGGPMKAAVSGGAPLPGTTFACMSCHTRSGLGFMEEGLRTPPVNGARLFAPRYPNFPGLSPSERAEVVPERFQLPPVRPAYTEATLLIALREGKDPNGRSFNPVMPRYQLNGDDAKILIAYLRNLSSRPSPGVTKTTLALATVITDEVPPEDRDAMLRPLERSIRDHNNLGNNAGHMGVMLAMQEMKAAQRQRTLARWILEGPPDTWEQQLQSYYQSEPVFALVGGLSTRSWEPIHRFCETRQIPCILPITDLPVISATDHYTLYFSKGYYHEGEAVARFLGTPETAGVKRIVQVVAPGPEGSALAGGFQKAWTEMGNGQVETITIEEAVRLGKGSVVMLWTGPESYGALRSLAANPDRPAQVFMSSTLLNTGLWDLPSDARAFTYLTYPFREPGEKKVVPKMGGRPVVVNKEYRKNDRRIASKTHTLVEILTDRLAAMERNFYRDHLLDLFGMLPDQALTDYENLSFGPGQRYASEGCYIMQLTAGPDPALIRKSGWAIY